MPDQRDVGNSSDPSCPTHEEAQSITAQETVKTSEAVSSKVFSIEWLREKRASLLNRLRGGPEIPPTEVDRLAQEVHERLLRYADDIAEDNPQGHLFGIASDVAKEWREQGRSDQVGHNHLLEQLQVDAPIEPSDESFIKQSGAIVQAAVDALPPRQREALLRHVNDGLTYKEIAAEQGVTNRIALKDLISAYSKLRMTLRLEDL